MTFLVKKKFSLFQKVFFFSCECKVLILIVYINDFILDLHINHKMFFAEE